MDRGRYGYYDPDYPNRNDHNLYGQVQPEYFQPYGRNENGSDAEWDDDTLVDEADAAYHHGRYRPPLFPGQGRV